MNGPFSIAMLKYQRVVGIFSVGVKNIKGQLQSLLTVSKALPSFDSVKACTFSTCIFNQQLVKTENRLVAILLTEVLCVSRKHALYCNIVKYTYVCIYIHIYTYIHIIYMVILLHIYTL